MVNGLLQEYDYSGWLQIENDGAELHKQNYCNEL